MPTQPPPPSLSRGRSAALLVALIALCFTVAAVGGLSTADAVRTWYPTLDKPPWTPPNQAFGPIWTTLYLLMAISMWLVATRGRSPRREAGLWTLQLGLNALWSPVFFAAHQTGIGLVVITALWLAIAACIATFWQHSRLAAGLMLPYLAWISIAWSLNAWIFWFN